MTVDGPYTLSSLTPCLELTTFIREMGAETIQAALVSAECYVLAHAMNVASLSENGNIRVSKCQVSASSRQCPTTIVYSVPGPRSTRVGRQPSSSYIWMSTPHFARSCPKRSQLLALLTNEDEDDSQRRLYGESKPLSSNSLS